MFPISGFPWFAGFGLMARLTLPIRKSATYQPSCCAPDKERSNSDNKPHSLSAALVNDLSGTWSPVRLNPMFRSFICAAFLHGTAPGSGNVREPAPSPEVGAPTYRQGERVGETDSGSRDSIQAFRIDDLRQGHFIESGVFTATIGGSNIGRPASQHVGTVRRVRSVDPDFVPMAGVSRDSHGAMVGQSRQASNTLASTRGDLGSAARDDHRGGGRLLLGRFIPGSASARREARARGRESPAVHPAKSDLHRCTARSPSLRWRSSTSSGVQASGAISGMCLARA